jgi:hypothetical protein
MNEHDKTQALKDFKRWHAADLKRIAELEAENKRLKAHISSPEFMDRRLFQARAEQAEAAIENKTKCCIAFKAALDEAEAELAALRASHAAQIDAIVQTRSNVEKDLAALKARWCENCADGNDDLYHTDQGESQADRVCTNDDSAAYGTGVDADFSCNRWTARQDGES